MRFDEGTIFISKSDAFEDWDRYDSFISKCLGILITDKKTVACNMVSVHFLQLEDAEKIVETVQHVFHKSFFEKIAEKFVDVCLFGLIEECDVINSGGFGIDATIKFLTYSKEAIVIFGEGETSEQALLNAAKSCPNFNQWRMLLVHFTGNKSVVNNSNIIDALPMTYAEYPLPLKRKRATSSTKMLNANTTSIFHREVKIRWAKTIDNNAESVKVTVIAACHELNLKKFLFIRPEGNFYILCRG